MEDVEEEGIVAVAVVLPTVVADLVAEPHVAGAIEVEVIAAELLVAEAIEVEEIGAADVEDPTFVVVVIAAVALFEVVVIAVEVLFEVAVADAAAEVVVVDLLRHWESSRVPAQAAFLHHQPM